MKPFHYFTIKEQNRTHHVKVTYIEQFDLFEGSLVEIHAITYQKGIKAKTKRFLMTDFFSPDAEIRKQRILPALKG